VTVVTAAGADHMEMSAMIISDDHRFVFVRNPKCAGLTIRHYLMPYDSYRGEFQRIATHPALGRLDFTHLPLATLREHFSEPFAKVCKYNSYAIIRDPRTRFASAVFYHLRRFKRIRPSSASLPLYEKEALAICAKLRSRNDRLNVELVHFLKQVDFVQLDGNRMVKDLYLVEELPRFASDFRVRHGISIDVSKRRNVNRTSDNSLVTAAKAVARPLYNKLFSEQQREKVRSTMDAAGQNSPQRMYEQLLANKSVSEFVGDYYRDDVALYAELRSRSQYVV